LVQNKSSRGLKGQPSTVASKLYNNNIIINNNSNTSLTITIIIIAIIAIIIIIIIIIIMTSVQPMRTVNWHLHMMKEIVCIHV